MSMDRTTGGCPPRLTSCIRRTQPWLAGGLTLTLLLAVGAIHLVTREAAAAGGDFHLDFIAAHEDSYNHSIAVETSHGALQYDDRAMGTHVREELEAADFACEDRIVFYTAISVDDDARNAGSDITLTYHFDARNNGQQAVGYREVVAAGISFEDFAGTQTQESGNHGLDHNESVTLVSQQYVKKPHPTPSGTVPGDFGDQDSQVLEAVVDVAGLDPGEQLIVRIDVLRQ